VNVFFVTTIAGSLIDCIYAIIQDPESTFSLLGGSLPKMGGFFMAYAVIKAFTGLGIELIRFAALVGAGLKSAFTRNTTPRDRDNVYLGTIRRLSNPGWFPIAKIYAQDSLFVLVCMTYACIAPFMLTACIAYFAIAAFVYKHQVRLQADITVIIVCYYYYTRISGRKI